MKPKSELLRVVRTPQGEVRLDPRGKLPGRGAYVCANPDCLKKAIKTRALDRALETKVPEGLILELNEELEDKSDG